MSSSKLRITSAISMTSTLRSRMLTNARRIPMQNQVDNLESETGEIYVLDLIHLQVCVNPRTSVHFCVQAVLVDGYTSNIFTCNLHCTPDSSYKCFILHGCLCQETKGSQKTRHCTVVPHLRNWEYPLASTIFENRCSTTISFHFHQYPAKSIITCEA